MPWDGAAARSGPGRGGHGHESSAGSRRGSLCPARGETAVGPAARGRTGGGVIVVERLVQVEPLGEGQERPQPAQDDLGRHRYRLASASGVGGGGWAQLPVVPADERSCPGVRWPSRVHLADQAASTSRARAGSSCAGRHGARAARADSKRAGRPGMSRPGRRTRSGCSGPATHTSTPSET